MQCGPLGPELSLCRIMLLSSTGKPWQLHRPRSSFPEELLSILFPEELLPTSFLEELLPNPLS